MTADAAVSGAHDDGRDTGHGDALDDTPDAAPSRKRLWW